MAILAPPDWQYSPRDPAMDKPSPSSSSSSTPPQQQQQRPHQLPQQQQPMHPQQYPGPFTQQPQGSWTPSLAAPPFYPGAFYQNPVQQSPIPSPYGPPSNVPVNVNPYFDPANAQLAQWAYQQMMFNAQQHGQHVPQQGQHENNFFAPPPGMHGQFNPFPSGTPPPRPSDAPQPQYPAHSNPQGQGGNGGGYHPYRRPSRQQSSHSETSAPQQTQDWARGPQPPYSRTDASGRASPHGQQQLAVAGQRALAFPRTLHQGLLVVFTAGARERERDGSGSSSTAPGPPPRIPHNRAGSSSSTHSAHSTSSASPSSHHAHSPTHASSGSLSSASSSAAKLARPSPLSASTLPPTRSPLSSSTSNSNSGSGMNPASRAERRISRDDSSLALSSLSLLATRAEAASSKAAAASASSSNANPNAAAGNAKDKKSSGGLKGLGRLRRALSFNASVALKEEVGGADPGADDDDDDDDEDDGEDKYGGDPRGSDSDESIKASVVNPKGAAAGKAKTPALIAATKKAGQGGASPASALSSGLPHSQSASSSSTMSPVPSSSSSPAGTQVPMPKKKSRAASLFNSRMNVSTDNISLSSTVSSASVMIRKLGSMGRLARRNSLAGITGLFKDRKKKKGEEGEGDEDEGGDQDEEDKDKKKDKKKDKDKDKGKGKDSSKSRTGKSQASEASVSHATAELEAGDHDWSVPSTGDRDTVGLSPAAKLARQHTLKSNAEAAAKAREAAARAAAVTTATATTAPNGTGTGAGTGAAPNGTLGANGVPTWDRNTATRSPGRQRGQGQVGVNEDGTHVLVEDSESEDEYNPNAGQGYPQKQDGYGVHQPYGATHQGGQGQGGGGYGGQQQQGAPHQQWDDDEDEEWGMLGGEEDDTIRVAVDPSGGQQEEEGDDYDGEDGDGGEHEPWAVDVRRSVERTRVPARGILKHAGTYDQAAYLPDAHLGNQASSLLRARSNSYTSPGAGQNELGPLARMPSPDPDHIDGLHRHGSHSSQHSQQHESSSAQTGAGKRSSIPSLPPLGFDLGVGSMFDSPQVTPTAATYAAAGQATSSPTVSVSSSGGTPTTPTPGAPSGAHAMYNHPALNSSAPALTTFGSGPTGVAAVPRAATAPVRKHLAFASNLSVYDTFSASMYDRRSEPATWSRLTPALAQRIKEELNSYKMEEMEVHAASRIHTQFFV
ncbi:hypothetical protein K438DRAFT_1779039 [Mycena galopus ATCC 62051]|nr:hypothetical protein K438DRAFT_1779039 [Mycena galopus ATCC 62051]